MHVGLVRIRYNEICGNFCVMVKIVHLSLLGETSNYVIYIEETVKPHRLFHLSRGEVKMWKITMKLSHNYFHKDSRFNEGNKLHRKCMR